MHQLKDIAARMDGCHPRTAKRWWRKLDDECVAAGLPRVCPDVQGHGPHRWEDATADRLIMLWRQYYAKRGTTPQMVKARYQGHLPEKNQLSLFDYHDSAIQRLPAGRRLAVRGLQADAATHSDLATGSKSLRVPKVRRADGVRSAQSASQPGGSTRAVRGAKTANAKRRKTRRAN
jgi:hypothetical protein